MKYFEALKKARDSGICKAGRAPKKGSDEYNAIMKLMNDMNIKEGKKTLKATEKTEKKSRGRPKKEKVVEVEVVEETKPKKRGRPKKKVEFEVDELIESQLKN